MKPEDIITITSDTIDLSTFTIDYNNMNTMSGTFNGVTYSDLSSTESNGITLKEGADITIGDRSLLKTLDTIAERLAILETNTKLEKEFEELRNLGDQYRKLEAELKDKMKTWNILSTG